MSLIFAVVDLCLFSHFELCQEHESEPKRYQQGTLLVDISHWVEVQCLKQYAPLNKCWETALCYFVYLNSKEYWLG